MATLQTRWQTLSARERAIVMGGAALVVIVTVYMLALSPFYASLEARARRVSEKQADLAYMRGVSTEVQTLAAAQPSLAAPNDESLVVLIDRTARESGVGSALTGQTPSGNNGIRIRLESAPFDSMVRWLGVLQQQHGIDVETATIDRAATTGVVNANLTLVRAGAG